MDFDYKKYSLENLENWLHDTIGGDATAQEVYDLILKVVLENYEHHKQYADKAYELLCKLKNVNQKKVATYDEMIAAGYCMTDDGFWMPPEKKDKVVKWQLPVEQIYNDYFVSFPDDLLEAANLKEGDAIEWIDNNNGSYTLRKV